MPTAKRVSSLISQECATIPSGGVAVFDQTETSDFRVREYTISITDEANGRNKIVKLLRVNREGLINYTVFSKIGSIIDVDFSSPVSGSTTHLEINNNEPVTISVCVTRFDI